jgi:hypothetical protein
MGIADDVDSGTGDNIQIDQISAAADVLCTDIQYSATK